MMKTLKIALVIAALLLTTTIDTMAQRGPRGPQEPRGACNLPDLTEDQETKIRELQVVQIEASNQHRAKMDELRAQKQSLSISENPDLNQINRIIDQMEKLRAEHLKAVEKHRQEIRSLLTSEQRAIFDSRHMAGRQPGMRGPGCNGRGQGQGRGNFGGPGNK